MKTLEMRIREALPGTTEREAAEKYIEVVREGLYSADRTLMRMCGTIILVATAYELAVQAAIKEATYAGLKVDPSFIQRFAPVLLAFLASRVVAVTISRRILMKGYEGLYRVIAPNMYANGLVVLSFPPALATDTMLRGLSDRETSARLARVITIVGFGIVVCGSVGFVAYALYQNFNRFGNSDVGVWLSLLVICLLGVQSLAYAWSSAAMLDRED
jgi:hypothetical protein